MAEPNTGSVPVMEDFNKFIDDTISSLKINMKTPELSLSELVEASMDEIDNWTSEECLARSFKISSYSLFLKGEINEIQAKLNWCEDALNRVFSEQWYNYDQFLKTEIKKQSIIKDNSFASSVENLRVLLKAKLVLLDDKIRDLRDLSQTLSDLGRRRGYNERN